MDYLDMHIKILVTIQAGIQESESRIQNKNIASPPG